MKVEVIKELHGLKIGTKLNCEPNSCLIKKGYVKPIEEKNTEDFEADKLIEKSNKIYAENKAIEPVYNKRGRKPNKK